MNTASCSLHLMFDDVIRDDPGAFVLAYFSFCSCPPYRSAEENGASPNSLPTVTYTRNAYLLVWSVNETIHTLKLTVHGAALSKSQLQLPSTPSGVVAGICDIAGRGTVIVGWNMLEAETLAPTFRYALTDPSGRLHYSTRNVAPQWASSDASLSLTMSSMQLTWTGDRLLYVSTMYDNRTEDNNAAVITAWDLPFSSDVRLSNARITPADFSNDAVTLAVRLTNDGRATVPAGGEVMFVFAEHNGEEELVGTAPITSELASGASVEVSLQWDSTTAPMSGGELHIRYLGAGSAAGDNELVLDPPAYGLGNASVTTMPDSDTLAIAAFLSVTGPSVAEIDLEAWTRLDSGDLVLLGSIKHTTKPNNREAIFIPLSSKAPLLDDLQIRAVGRNYRTTLHTTGNDGRYDFSLVLDELTIMPIEDDNIRTPRYLLHIPVHNFGTTGANVSVDFVRFDRETNTTAVLKEISACGWQFANQHLD